MDKILPSNTIVKIKYFTARVSGKYDPDEPVRQDVYLRALGTLKRVEIIEGKFTYPKKRIHVTREVDIYASMPEEKGTDVNLAAHLINDAHLKRFDAAFIVSNDSDLREPIKIVTQELKLKVGILNPYSTFSAELCQFATSKQSIRAGAINQSQFAPVIKIKGNQLTKPRYW